jgi:phage terminase large subunit-like protein
MLHGTTGISRSECFQALNEGGEWNTWAHALPYCCEIAAWRQRCLYGAPHTCGDADMAANARRLAELSSEQRRELLATMTPAELQRLEYSWQFWRQPHQTPPPPPWRLWLLCAGRGAGKSWTGAQWVRNQIETGRRRSIALIAPTHLAGRKVMIEDGLLRLCPPDNMPVYEMATGVVRWQNGGACHLFSSETPDRVRGYNFDGAWCDELGAWENAEDCWDQLSFALRLTGPLGDEPQIIGTTTPRPTKLLRRLLADPDTRVTRASTFDNRANLNPTVLRHLEERYSGSRIGRQELLGELLVDTEGALWTRSMMDACHIEHPPLDLRRIVVSIDPAGSSNKHSDETGIVVAGVDRAGIGYVLRDLSGKYSPEAWARKAISAYKSWHADRIIAEKNFGGDMVMSTLKNVDPGVAIKVVTASRGKAVRAEPIASLYEQGRIKHVGNLGLLEDQLCEWNPAANGPSPDRLDACIAQGSLIKTRRGEVAIEDVVVGDYALTRRGYRKVTATRMTSAQADVMLIETPIGSVFATPDHRFFVNGVWTRADAIVCGDLISSVLPTASAVLDGLGPQLAHGPVVCVSTSAKLPVYDLTVDGEHEFFANNLLTHNCVWGLTELMGRPPLKISPELLANVANPHYKPNITRR